MLTVCEGKAGAELLSVDVGAPTIIDNVKQQIIVDDHTYEIMRITVGNPHCIMFVDNFN